MTSVVASIETVDTPRAPGSDVAAVARSGSKVSSAIIRGHPVRRWLLYLGLLGVALVELDEFAPYVDRATGNLVSADPWWLLLAIAAELCSMRAFARVQRQMLAAGGAVVSMRRMSALTYAANAVNATLPGGSVLSTGYVFRRLRRWGATAPAAGFTVLASGVLSTVAFAIIAITCALLVGGGWLTGTVIIGVVGAIAVVAVFARLGHRLELLVRAAVAVVARANRLLHRPSDAGVAPVLRFVAELTAVRPRSRDWLAGLGFAGLNWVADLACLAASCEAVGARPATVALVMYAYVAGMTVSSLSLLPGGLGIVDAAMIFALAHGGVSTVAATAGVLVYRLISFGLVVLLGWLVWVIGWVADRRRSPSQDDDDVVTPRVQLPFPPTAVLAVTDAAPSRLALGK